ncbi:amidohydrolase family protein [Streptomyces sp. NPDC052107]|uniref:amidohydrolase family protein n=1 Tax=Streptomyces sp. NPDC052107 TaxID=3155632 RepID=UPI00341939F3
MAAAAVARHPARFRSLSTLPMSSLKGVPAELERAAGMGHVGTMVYGRPEDLFLDDPVYDDFFGAASEIGQPVFIHPQLPSRAVRDASYRGFDPMTELALATFGWGWHMDTATAALRLILRGALDRHPDLQVVLGHRGETLLIWLDRADSISRSTRPRRGELGSTGRSCPFPTATSTGHKSGGGNKHRPASRGHNQSFRPLYLTGPSSSPLCSSGMSRMASRV